MVDLVVDLMSYDKMWNFDALASIRPGLAIFFNILFPIVSVLFSNRFNCLIADDSSTRVASYHIGIEFGIGYPGYYL